MALHNIEYNLQSDNRTGIRIEVAKLFTLEEPGIVKVKIVPNITIS